MKLNFSPFEGKMGCRIYGNKPYSPLAQRNKNVGPRAQKSVPVRMTIEEYDQIKRTAEKVRLPVSTLHR